MRIGRAAAILLAFQLIVVWACEKDSSFSEVAVKDESFGPTPYFLKVPDGFPDYFLDEDKQLTEEGVSLGRKLFFDPILSKNNDVSCGSCHLQSEGFSDSRKRSIGTNGTPTGFHSMPIFNIAWMNEFFWDGRAKSREAQALQPVINPLEMDLTWEEAVSRLQNHDTYPSEFKKAFGTEKIDSNLVARALVQFEMTLISSNSRFDKFWNNEIELTPLEQRGRDIFFTEDGDCFHCHSGILTTDNEFHNNGLDNDADLEPGLFNVTGDPNDYGKFKTPTLRNLVLTAPYMHDGRFDSLEQVIDFYSTGVNNSRNLDPNMLKRFPDGVRLSDPDKEALLAFLKTMNDTSLTTNSAYSNPFDN